ncbi:MAG: SlyX family protein [Alphaproteobacteria bacterium]|nr:SlyX family protein [Alphaproteobacteria bacterium]
MADTDRLTEIERHLANLEAQLDDLNSVVIQQGRKIDRLEKDYRALRDSVDASLVKPLSEETPPPHY